MHIIANRMRIAARNQKKKNLQHFFHFDQFPEQFRIATKGDKLPDRFNGMLELQTKADGFTRM